jgi:hypothetical protein
MEYVGSGTNYTALPENGGVPIEANQVVESNNGKIWTATTDHNGKFKIGDFFEVDQQLGFVTIPNGSISFDLASDATPQLGGNLDVNGNTITSASNANVVIDPNGTGTIELGSDVTISSTGFLTVPVGDDDDRDALTGVAGMLRFNSDSTKFEGFNGTAWSTVGGGATGGGSDAVFVENGNTVTADYTISANSNAMSAGPITINADATVTIPTGSTWVIV